MTRAGLENDGDSQLVWLPDGIYFEGADVVVSRVGAGLLLTPANLGVAGLRAALTAFEPGFEISREQPPAEDGG